MSSESPSGSVLSEQVGHTVTFEGRPQNRKNGVALVGEGAEVWLLDDSVLPEGTFDAGHTGPLMRFTGILDEDQGLPVFIDSTSDQEGEGLAVQGIPVPPGTDLSEAGRRFVLRQASLVKVLE